MPSTFDQNVKSILDRIRSQAPPAGAAAPAQSQSTGYGSAFSPSWTPAPSRPAAQPTSAGPNWRALWDRIRNIGGETGPADDVARAREANAKRERQRAAAEKAVEARQEQFESGPWGITFNPERTKPFQREPGINFAGGRTNARKAEDIAAARAERAKQSIVDYDRKALMDSDSRTENIVELTTEQWNALTPAQQDAVQFNTNLVKAIERDRANQGSYAPSDDQRQEYNRILTDVLGTAVSKKPEGLAYAPETVALLRHLDTLPQQRIGSLDKFLNLDVAITAEEVQRIEERLQPQGPEHLVGRRTLSAEEKRLERAQALARAQGQMDSQLQRTLSRGDALLADMSGVNIAATAGSLGAVERTMPTLTDVEAEGMNLYIQALADPSNDVGEALQQIQSNMVERGLDEQGQQRVYQAMIETARSGMTGGQWFDEQAAQWGGVRTPQEVAGALGIPTEKVR